MIFWDVVRAKSSHQHHKHTFKTKSQAKLVIFEFIEVWYNRKRRHSSLGHLTSLEFEKTILNRKKVTSAGKSKVMLLKKINVFKKPSGKLLQFLFP